MTRYYDRWGRRIPSPRGESVPLDGYVYAWLMGVVLAVTVMAVAAQLGG